MHQMHLLNNTTCQCLKIILCFFLSTVLPLDFFLVAKWKGLLNHLTLEPTVTDQFKWHTIQALQLHQKTYSPGLSWKAWRVSFKLLVTITLWVIVSFVQDPILRQFELYVEKRKLGLKFLIFSILVMIAGTAAPQYNPAEQREPSKHTFQHIHNSYGLILAHIGVDGTNNFRFSDGTFK